VGESSLEPIDGAYDESFESSTALMASLGAPGFYEICVRAFDSAGNFSSPACEIVEVLDR